MARDAISFMVILLIIFLAFSSGLCELFTPYGPGHGCTCNSTAHCNASLPLVQVWNITQDENILPACVACRKLNDDEKQTTSLLDSLLGIWWTTFGYGDPRKWYIISNCPETFVLQEVVGFFIVAVYHFTVIIVLFNMLIAMMSNSFQTTQDDSVREWKFYRTHLWLKLVSNKITRLPPMNIVPEMKHIKKSLRWFAKLFTKLWRKMRRTRNNSGNGDIYQNDGTTTGPNGAGGGGGGSTTNHINLTRRRNAEAVISSPEDERYEKVLRLIVLRYVKKKVLRDEMVI